MDADQSRTRDTFVFDGDCGFCRRWAEWLGRRLRFGCEIRPYESFERLQDVGLTTADVRRRSYWVSATGEVYGGHRGFAAAFRHSRGLWPLLGVVMDLPVIRVVAALVYRWVARHRTRLPAPPRRDG